MRRLMVLLPLAFFIVMAGTFFYALQTGDPSKLPSALMNKPVPSFVLPGVKGLVIGNTSIDGFSKADLTQGNVTLINVWASWCGPCRIEHPFLMQLAETKKVRIFGINYKDDPAAARRFLGQLGNPYDAIGADNSGRTAIDWGVYGVPETFVVDGSGKIVFKHVGPITEKILSKRLLPAIENARSKESASTL